ncbi:MAG: hypothetical protein ACO1SV_21810 [Fimbriimonas sp.]
MRNTPTSRPGLIARARAGLRETYRQFAAAYRVLANPAFGRLVYAVPPPIPAPLAVPPLATWAIDAIALRDLERNAPFVTDVAAVLDRDEIHIGALGRLA